MRSIVLAFVLALPVFAADLPPADLDAKLAEGKDLAAKAQKLEAFAAFEAVIRGSADQAHKFAARDEIYKMGPIPARPQADGEQALVRSRILDERHRYYGDCMDRLADKGLLRGVMLFRKRIWEDNGKRADDSQVQAMRDLESRILRNVSKEDKAEVEKVKTTVKKELWVKAAEQQERSGNKMLALQLYKETFHWAGITDEKEIERIRGKIDAIEKDILDDISPEEQQAFDDAIRHRVWDDLSTRESHHFIFIGDRFLLPHIPDESILKLDLTYIFLTDMLDNNPDADGQRITIFFKELWNFGGGIGGGKTIDIGSVDIRAKVVSVSNFLYFHELSHCLFDKAMIFHGFTEGVANFGATMACCSVGMTAEGEGLFKSNLEAFHRDFLGRDETYFRTQPYGPTCGFWLYFLDKYGRTAGVADWSLYRRFFRLWESRLLSADTNVEKSRAFGRCLAQVFGPGIWKDMASFGFPVGPEDEERMKSEDEDGEKAMKSARASYDAGNAKDALEKCEAIWKGWPESPMAALARRIALNCLDQLKQPGSDAIRKELGLVMEWKVAGPFYTKGGNALFDIHPPEWEIDYAKEYDDTHGKAKWFDPKVRFDGLVTFEFPYMDGIACYGVVNVKVPAATEAWIHIGSDDGCGVWVNGELADKIDAGRGVLFDQDRFTVRLLSGWNRVLVKIRNGSGTMGFAGRITDTHGRGIEGAEFTSDPFETPFLGGKKPGKAEPVWKDDFTAKNSFARYAVPCGGWTVVKPGVMYGTEEKHNMQWQKFLVTPGKEKDSPAQCIWVKDSTFKGAKNLAIDLKLAMASDGRPKFMVSLDAEGQNDGLSGTTLIFSPNDEGCSVRLLHYERPIYDNPEVKFPAAKEHTMRLIRFKDRMTVTFDEQKVFDDISMPAITKSNFLGIATWNKATGLDDLTVYKLAEK